MTEHRTVRMWCDNLAAIAIKDRLPLSSLTVDSHVHGELHLQIADRQVPYLGYWGPDDVCFGQWLDELRQAASALEQSGGRHVFDEGEQGQPAFVFERDSDRGYFSIVASEFSGANADPDWQRIEFVPSEFIAAYHGLNESFKTTLREASPELAEKWLARHFNR